MKTLKPYSLALCCSLVLLSVAQGCGDHSEANPTPPNNSSGKGNGGSGNKAGNTGKGGDAKGGEGSNEGGTDATGGTGTDGGVGNEGGTGGTLPLPTCDLPETGADGCFNCPKNGELEQWLNRCTEGDCLPFDNAARLPLLENDGSRPDLPN